MNSKTYNLHLTVPVAKGQPSVDRNDCTVRALVNATGMSYDLAMLLLAKHGRKAGQGAYPDAFIPAYKDAGLTLVGVFGTTRAATYTKGLVERSGAVCKHYKGITLASLLLKIDRSKTYIAIISGHAVCIKGGQVVDTFVSKAGKSVVSLFRV